MKNLSIVVFALALIRAASSYACDHQTLNLCPGDSVITAGVNLGEVVGVNPLSHLVAIRITATSGTDAKVGEVTTQNDQQIFIRVGCLGSFCVGDPVVTQGNNLALIVGINRFTEHVALQLTQITTDRYDGGSVGEMVSQSVRTISARKGCVEGFCIGDTAVTSSNDLGLIVGINAVQGTASIQVTEVTGGYYSNSKVGSIHTDSIERITLAKLCETYGQTQRRSARAKDQFEFHLR